MKRAISLFLATVFAVAMATPAFAAEDAGSGISSSQRSPSVAALSGDQFVVDDMIYDLIINSGGVIGARVVGPQDKSAVVDITIPQQVTNPDGHALNVFLVDSNAFESCPNLTNVILPYSVKMIGAAAFKSCPFLMSVTCPGVTTVEENAFYNDFSLTYVGYGTLNWIGQNAFYGTALTGVTISPYYTETPPGSGYYVETSAVIGAGAFQNCYALSRVNFLGNIAPSIGAGAFDGVASGAAGAVPSERIGTTYGMYNPDSYPFVNGSPLTLIGL